MTRRLDAHADAMRAALVLAVPFGPDEAIRIVEVGGVEGRLAAHLLAAFPRATMAILTQGEAQRAAVSAAVTPFGDRAQVRPFDVAALDWWDVMFGADLVAAFASVHRLNDAKTQYFYKAAADRMSARGVLLVADAIAPMRAPSARPAGEHASPLFHQLVWLRHAGFDAVDCVWYAEDAAVFGGFKQAAASERQPPVGS